MEKLTNQVYWDKAWQKARLPILVDLEGNYNHRQTSKLLERYLEKGNKRILEVGCGSSMWLIYFHKVFGYQVYGLDNSQEACEISKKNIEMANVPGKIICQDILQNTLDKEFFDVVASGGVMEHFTNPFPVLKKMTELLRPGGKLVTTVPNMDFLVRYVQKIFDREAYETHQKIRVEDLHTFYRQLGLRVIAAGFYGIFSLTSIDWYKFQPDSRVWKEMVPMIGKINGSILRILKFLNIERESRYFSPHIFAIGQK